MDPVSIAVCAVAAALAAGLALFTFTRNPSHPLNRACAALFAVLAASHVGAALVAAPAGLALWTGAEGWLPAAALGFGLRLGNADPGADRAFFLWTTRGALLLGVAGTAAALSIVAVGSPGAAPPAGKAGIVAALLLCVAALVQLENVYRASQGEVRYRIKYLILGVAALLAMRVYVLSLAAVYDGVAPEAIPELALATWVGGAMAAYAVVRHRLLDVDIFISRYVIYNSIALAGTGAYLLIVGLALYGLTHIGRAVPVWLVPSVVLAAVIVLAVGLLSDTVRWRVRHFVDRNFYKNRHDYRAQWQAASRAVAAERTVGGFLGALARMVQGTLGARQVATLLREPGTDVYVPYPEGAPDAPPPVREADLRPDPDPAWHPAGRGVEVYRNAASAADVLYLPLVFREERIGLVALWPRISDVPYHLEDLELASAMAAQTAVAVRNRQLATDLVRSREVAALHQVSTFFIHDIKNVANSLGLLARNIQPNRENPEFWADAEAGIRQAVDQMRVLMDRLKELREKVPAEPRPIELAALLESWTGEWGRTVPAQVVCDTDGPLRCKALPEQLKSVFTNLVMNAAEAGATRVRVEGAAPNGQVRVTVSDDGCGMAPEFVARELFRPFVTTKPQGMGIGLFQSRRIVEQLGGRLTVSSRPGEGSRFTVVLPAEGAAEAAPTPSDEVPEAPHG